MIVTIAWALFWIIVVGLAIFAFLVLLEDKP